MTPVKERMTVHDAHRCVSACANYLQTKDDSPQAARDLREAVFVITEHCDEGKADSLLKWLDDHTDFEQWDESVKDAVRDAFVSILSRKKM